MAQGRLEVCLFACLLVTMAIGVAACIEVLTESAIQRHGAGTVLTLFESLVKAHSIHIESAPHGCFTKMFYSRTMSKSPSTSPTRSPSSSSSSVPASPEIRRHELLERRPPPGLHHRQAMGYRVAKYAEVFDMARSDTAEHATCSAACKPAQCSHRTVVKNTFLEVDNLSSCDSESIGAASAPELSCQHVPNICLAQVGPSTAVSKIEVAATDRHVHEVCGSASEASLLSEPDNALDSDTDSDTSDGASIERLFGTAKLDRIIEEKSSQLDLRMEAKFRAYFDK